MGKFLDKAGLQHYDEKIKAYVDSKSGGVNTNLTSHIGNKKNLHGVTKEQDDLGNNVTNYDHPYPIVYCSFTNFKGNNTGRIITSNSSTYVSRWYRIEQPFAGLVDFNLLYRVNYMWVFSDIRSVSSFFDF